MLKSRFALNFPTPSFTRSYKPRHTSHVVAINPIPNNQWRNLIHMLINCKLCYVLAGIMNMIQQIDAIMNRER